jgi:serine/threonine-protein kinase
VDAARGVDLDAPDSLDSGSSDSDELTGGGAVAGTVAYLSPEAINGDPPDPSFDIWSLSLVLYEAIAGTNPIQGVAREETVSNILYREIPDLRRYTPACPAAVAEFFHDALNGDRDRRPATGQELAEQLRALGERLTRAAIRTAP